LDWQAKRSFVSCLRFCARLARSPRTRTRLGGCSRDLLVACGEVQATARLARKRVLAHSVTRF